MTQHTELLNYLASQETTQPELPAEKLPPHVLGGWSRITNVYLESFDPTSPARVRAYWAENAILAATLMTDFPEDISAALHHRAFHNRAVRYMAGHGIRQFVDLGSGDIGTYDVHHVADAWSRQQPPDAKPDIKAFYIDNDDVAVTHGEIFLDKKGDPDRQRVHKGDVRHPYSLWRDLIEDDDAPGFPDRGLIDPTKPIGLLVTGTMQQAQPDSAGNEIGAASLAQLRELLPAGSYMALSHVTHEIPDTPEQRAEAADRQQKIHDFYRQRAACTFISRTIPEIEALLGDFQPVADSMTRADVWGLEYDGPGTLQLDQANLRVPLVLAGVAQKL